MLFRAGGDPASQKPTVTYTVNDMLAYRDTFTAALPDVDLETKLAPRGPPAEPPKPLTASENAFKAGGGETASKADKLVRQVQSTLNKLTSENYDALVPPLLQRCLFEPGVVDQVVAKIFAKALDEQAYAFLYARLCLELAEYENQYLESAKTVRTSIISKAQDVYQAQRLAKASVDGDEDELTLLRKKKIGNIKFVALLYREKLLSANVIRYILREVLANPPPAELELEMMVLLLNEAGTIIDTDPKINVDEIFARLGNLKEHTAYCKRVQFLIMNLIDLRKRGWSKPAPSSQDLTELEPITPAARQGSEFPGNAAASPQVLELRPPLPPDADSKDVNRVIKALMTMTDNSAEVLKSASILLSDQTAPVNRAVCYFYLIDHGCLSSKAETRSAVEATIALPQLDRAEVRAGLSWALTSAVVNMVAEDCPKYYERYCDLLLSCAKDRSTFKGLIKDVITPGIAHLDAVYDSHEGGVEWDEGFIAFWGVFMLCSKRKAAAMAGVVPPLAEVLDAMAVFKPTGLAGRVMTDIISEMVDNEFCSIDDLAAWRNAHEKSQKLQGLIQAMELLV